MYIEECDVEETRLEVIKSLKNMGVKHRIKKIYPKPTQVERRNCSQKVFRTHLEKLRHVHVNLAQSSRPVEVPAFLVEACSYIRGDMRLEGLFRKAGSSSRQNQLKVALESGERLHSGSAYHVIDVANILKTFLRELPEPLIPFKYHDLIIRCLLGKDAKALDSFLLTCLLLPLERLNALAYLMQFLKEVALNCKWNKMDAGNLALIFMPTILPLVSPGRMMPHGMRFDHHRQAVHMLIEHAELIGTVPHYICERLQLPSPFSSHDKLDSSEQHAKKKRRSGSLTRMINGLKRMVNKKDTPEVDVASTLSPDLAFCGKAHTPLVMSSGKKRRAEDLPVGVGLSAKKRRSILKCLPENSVLVCTPACRRNLHLSPRVVVAQQNDGQCIQSIQPITDKVSSHKVKPSFFKRKLQSDSVINKASKQLSGSSLRKMCRLSSGHIKHKSADEDSSVEFRSFTPDSTSGWSINSEPSAEEDYVRIHKSEYEDIKSRVSEIESRISQEFENIVGISISDLENTPESNDGRAKSVQSVYEMTLEESGKLNHSQTDELAARLGRELKIRRSLENRVIRSPSARKIGSLRRRSKENEIIRPALLRNLSLNTCDRPLRRQQLYPRRSLRRGRPNTIFSGLPHPSPKGAVGGLPLSSPDSTMLMSRQNSLEPSDMDMSFGVLTRSQAQKSCFPDTLSKLSVEKKQIWTSAEQFLAADSSNECIVTGRASIAEIRSQNAGMVLAKARLFDTMVDVSDNVNRKKSKTSKSGNKSKPQATVRRKQSKSDLVPPRGNNLLRYKTLSPIDPSQDRQGQRKAKSPSSLTGQLNLIAGKENYFSHMSALPQLPPGLKDTIYDICTPTSGLVSCSPLRDSNRTSGRKAPLIKQPLSLVGTPKHLMRTPNGAVKGARATPMKAMALTITPRRSPRLVTNKMRTLAQQHVQ